MTPVWLLAGVGGCVVGVLVLQFLFALWIFRKRRK